jgi:hypothetical protein
MTLAVELEWVKWVPRPYTMKRVWFRCWVYWSILFEEAPILHPCCLIFHKKEAQSLCNMLNGAYLMGWSECHMKNELEISVCRGPIRLW